MSTNDPQDNRITPQPLLGKRLLLTRSAIDNARWAAPLSELGAEVIELDCIRTELTGNGSQILEALKAADWVVLSSKKGAEAALLALKLLNQQQEDPNLIDFHRPQLACFGGTTALAAKPLFGAPRCTAPGGTMASLGSELAALLSDELPQSILEIACEGGRRELEVAFKGGPHAVRRLELYRICCAKSSANVPPLFHLTGGRIDLALFASPSALKGLFGIASVPRSLPCVSLGPTTTLALREAGLRPCAEAHSRDLVGIIDATCRALGVSSRAFLP